MRQEQLVIKVPLGQREIQVLLETQVRVELQVLRVNMGYLELREKLDLLEKPELLAQLEKLEKLVRLEPLEVPVVRAELALLESLVQQAKQD